MPPNRLLFWAAAVMLALSVAFTACEEIGSTAGSSAADRTTKQTIATVQTMPAPDGWSIALIPGTDKMIFELEQSNNIGLTSETIGPPPSRFIPSVAADGDRVVYSALYDKAPQVYVYDIPSSRITQLTNNAPATYLPYTLEVQISGDWVGWMSDGGDDIHLRNLATGEARQFIPRQTVDPWRLIGNRLAWEEMRQLHDSKLYLYDPTVGSVQTIDAARGLLCFDIDDKRIAWAGGPRLNEVYLYDLASGQTRKVAEESQTIGDGDSIALRGDILAWTERTGDRTTLVIYHLDTDDRKVADEFGPFNPELVSDGRYVAWNREEEDTGTEVWVYDTEAGLTTTLAGTRPSIDCGRLAWSGERGEIMVRDLENSRTTQLTTSGQWIDQPPAVNGEHVVWARRNLDSESPEGQGIFVATAPANSRPHEQ